MNLSRGNYETIKKKKKKILQRGWAGEERRSGRGRYAPHACKKIFLFVDFVLS